MRQAGSQAFEKQENPVGFQNKTAVCERDASDSSDPVRCWIKIIQPECTRTLCIVAVNNYHVMVKIVWVGGIHFVPTEDENNSAEGRTCKPEGGEIPTIPTGKSHPACNAELQRFKS